MALIDLDGLFLQVNRALCHLLGRSQDELLALRWQQVTHPDDLPVQLAAERESILAPGRSYQMEKRFLRPDRTVVWAWISRSVVTDPAGTPLYFVSQIIDVSARRRAEEALRAREEQTRRILETAEEAFIGMDAEGRITDWNRKAELIFGWTAREALGRTVADTVIPPRDRETHRRGLARFLATGDGPVLNRRLELSALRRDGTEFPVELTIWALEVGGRYRFNALVHDIEDRVQAQAELSRQKEELAALHETTLGLISRLEQTSLLEAILSRAAALMGTPHAYLYVVDERADEQVVRAGIGVFADYVGYRIRRGEGLAGRVWASGEPLAVDDYHAWSGRRPEFGFIHGAVAIPLRSGEDIVGVIGLVHVEEGPTFGPEEIDLLSRFGRLASVALDNARLYSAAQQELNERRRAEKELARYTAELRLANEELRAADEMKSHFVAMASHELRTPLTSVLGFTTTLLNHWGRIPDDEKRGHLRIIETQARRLTRLADELLTMSKIEAGALETRPQPVDVQTAIRQAVSTFADRASDIEVTAADSLSVLADPDHFQQILTNYLANALRHGGPPVQVLATEKDGVVEVVVRDHGGGVPTTFVPRLFEKFAQAVPAQGEGTGLGLSIVRGLAQAQNGEAWYEPAQPTGARFGVRLPRATA
jgi:PAS domain S-box-containing protein